MQNQKRSIFLLLEKKYCLYHHAFLIRLSRFSIFAAQAGSMWKLNEEKNN